jgi:hypothetical protein
MDLDGLKSHIMELPQRDAEYLYSWMRGWIQVGRPVKPPPGEKRVRKKPTRSQ